MIVRQSILFWIMIFNQFIRFVNLQESICFKTMFITQELFS